MAAFLLELLGDSDEDGLLWPEEKDCMGSEDFGLDTDEDGLDAEEDGLEAEEARLASGCLGGRPRFFGSLMPPLFCDRKKYLQIYDQIVR